MAKKGILSLESFPYTIVLILGVISWCITHMVDRLTSSPAIKCSISREQFNNARITTYSLKNITRDKKFENLDMFFDGTKDTILAQQITYLPPMKKDPAADVFEQEGKYAIYHLTEFQPGCLLNITITTRGHREIPLRLSSKSPVLLLSPSIETCLLENEMLIQFLFLVTGLAFLVFYFVNNQRNSP
ncbi:MAG TPA: hypothetical protein VK543_11375 [Puia sp.]|nr:hypothetical protein [Puia sp.]